jgi:hypothetical protein
MNEEIYDEVQAFVSKFWHVKKGKLKEETELGKLGMAGDDAIEFMEAFMEKFNVDMTEFEFDKHFDPECFDLLKDFYRLFLLMFDRKRLLHIPITLRDLTEAAESKKWPKREWPYEKGERSVYQDDKDMEQLLARYKLVGALFLLLVIISIGIGTEVFMCLLGIKFIVAFLLATIGTFLLAFLITKRTHLIEAVANYFKKSK